MSGDVINLKLEEAKRRVDLQNEVKSLVRPSNPRADAIADEVDRLGDECIRPITDRGRAEFEEPKSMFLWLYYRLSGQDKKLPCNDAWIDHPHQRKAVMLHPVDRGYDYIEGQFIDPNGTGKWRVTLERVEGSR